MKFAEMKEQCRKAHYVIDDGGIDVCALAKQTRCSGYSCPSKVYWNKAHRNPGYHKQRALERTGLVKQFEEEIGG